VDGEFSPAFLTAATANTTAIAVPKHTTTLRTMEARPRAVKLSRWRPSDGTAGAIFPALEFLD